MTCFKILRLKTLWLLFSSSGILFGRIVQNGMKCFVIHHSYIDTYGAMASFLWFCCLYSTVLYSNVFIIVLSVEGNFHA